jgi:hypothetical protein
MCNFFTFCSDPTKPIPERFLYFDWPYRQKIIAGELKYEADSHTSIADFYGYKGVAEDTLNKYEYNPLLARFKVDQINNKVNDAPEAEAWVRALDLKKVIAPLVIKPIINPFKMAPPEITPEVLALLRQWASVRASVRDSVGVYLSSFFSITYKLDFSPAVKLWEMGLVPSFDGKKWRLHGKEKADILWKESPKGW